MNTLTATWEMRLPVISTAHLTQGTLRRMQASTPRCPAIPMDHGFIADLSRYRRLPADLRAVRQWLRAMRYESDVVRFDDNADPVPGLGIQKKTEYTEIEMPVQLDLLKESPKTWRVSMRDEEETIFVDVLAYSEGQARAMAEKKHPDADYNCAWLR